ncbi:MAG: hypothetical protein NDJ89_02360 [Oligoflexia bacterium]|nr:hypothetical protein [Oligoflexia bacterium]
MKLRSVSGILASLLAACYGWLSIPLASAAAPVSCAWRFSALEQASGSGASTALEVKLVEVAKWELPEIRANQGRVLHFSAPGSEKFVTVRQLLRTEEQLPGEEREFVHKLLKMAHKPRFVAGAIENSGGTEKGLFRILLEKELAFLRESRRYDAGLAGLSEDALLAKAELQVLAASRWKPEWKDWVKQAHPSEEELEAYRKINRIKPREPSLSKPGHQRVVDGVEIGALRLTIAASGGRPAETRTFFYTSRDFHAMGGTDEMIERLKADPRFRFADIEAAEVFHNHPGASTIPLSRADSVQLRRIQQEVERHLGRPVRFTVHAVQEKEGQAFVFSAQVSD